MTSNAPDASGMSSAPSLAGAEADEGAAILCYTHGMMADGRPYYAYIAVRPSRYQAFRAVTAAKENMRLADYGTVIAAGFEPDAPAEVVQDMRERYGFDQEFEYKLITQVRTQEEKRLEDIVATLKKTGDANFA